MNESIITSTYSLKLGYEICARIQKLKDDEHERKKKTHRAIQIPPTKGMAPHSNPQTRATTCLIQCNTSPN